jgi:hypothetical protein
MKGKSEKKNRMKEFEIEMEKESIEKGKIIA